MRSDTFAILSEPTRLDILTELRNSERSVGDLVELVGMSQPAVSKHLKILRNAEFVSSRVSGQKRIYKIEPTRFQAIDEWLEPYRELWTKHLDALERHLDEKKD